MAQGLLHPSSSESKDMEDIGNEYFDILLQSSLFQDATMSDNGIVSKCKMHDLVHDLAELVSKSESLMEDLCGRDNTLEIQHVARVSTSTLEKIPQRSAVKLRSLFSDDGEVPSNILPQFKALRVLNLSNASIEEFPDSIGRLKHLRYLDISETRFKALPSSIGKLYNLQTLKATNCALKEFPKELQNLINLRHIYFDKSVKFPQKLRRLTCLQTLPYFSVGNETGRRIEELAGLKQLKGELIICNLEHVKNGEEAKKAMLVDKTKVHHLTFRWTEGRSTTDNSEEDDDVLDDRSTTNNNEERNVLEGLRPHLELKSLSIENFMGDKFPSWMMSRSLLLNNLNKIQLLGCEKCGGVPPLGHLPNLTELKISRMASLKCIGVEFYGYDLVHNIVATTSKERVTLFPALKVLHIYECSDLIEWMEAPTMSTKEVVVFPCLEELDIRICFELRKVPSHFPSLQKLVMISSCCRMPIEEISSGLTTLTSFQITSINELTCLPQGILKKNKNLSSLEICGCDDLTCISGDVFGLCGCLERLVINNCGKLRQLPDGLETLPLLEELSIYGCPSLELIPITQGMTSLRKLEIYRCERLCLPSGLDYCTSLRELQIVSCNGLSAALGGLQCCTSLQKLIITNCNGLSGRLSVWASLVELSIENWKNLTSIEIKGGKVSLTSLQRLTIGSCDELSSLHILAALPHQCPSLQEVNISGCPKLALFGVESSSAEEEKEWCISDLRTMTSLRLLRIQSCERLESWVSRMRFPLSLETLSIGGLPNSEILPSLDNLNSLRDLTIISLPNIKYLPTGLQSLPRLNQLHIGPLSEELDSFPNFQVGSLTHLTRLELWGWPKLKSLPQQIQHLTSLTYLGLHQFDGVDTLPEWLANFTSLTYLLIQNCKNLLNLPSVEAMQRLTKLQTLYISGCHPLLKQRCTRDSGTYWPMISHIPDITIY